MRPVSLRYLGAQWIKNLASVAALESVLGAFGALWLAVEMAVFFASGTALPNFLRSQWWLFALFGIAAAIWRCRPRLIYSCKLHGRDVVIQIVVSDFWALAGAKVIGSNTTFDTEVSQRLINEQSIQGAFTRKYYSDQRNLDIELERQLEGVAFQDLGDGRIGKRREYAVGTCARLDPKGCTAYFLALARINRFGVAKAGFEDLKNALASLWEFIGTRGSKEDVLIPVLGTGFSRLTESREEVIREIIISFLAACSERTLCDKLTIVVSPHDLVRHKISLEDLGSFLRHHCRYTKFASATAQPMGSPAAP